MRSGFEPVLNDGGKIAGYRVFEREVAAIRYGAQFILGGGNLYAFLSWLIAGHRSPRSQASAQKHSPGQRCWCI